MQNLVGHRVRKGIGLTRKISLAQLRAVLEKEFGDQVVVSLEPKGNWVFAPWGQQLKGSQPHDEWLIGREGREFFDVGMRNPAVAPWGQPEIREEPLAPRRPDGKRIVGHVVVRRREDGLVHVTPTSLTKAAYVPKAGDREIGVFQTNAPRIDGDVAVVLRDNAGAEVAEGWDTSQAWRRKGDYRITQAMDFLAAADDSAAGEEEPPSSGALPLAKRAKSALVDETLLCQGKMNAAGR